MADVALSFSVIPGGPFPSVYARDMKGGAHTVANIAARDAVPSYLREVGMFVTCADTGTTFQLGTDLTTWSVTSSGFTQIIWAPSHPSPGLNVFSTWATVAAYITQFAGAVIVNVDSTYATPTITTSLDCNGKTEFVAADVDGVGNSTDLRIADGAQLTNPAAFTGAFTLIAHATIREPILMTRGVRFTDGCYVNLESGSTKSFILADGTGDFAPSFAFRNAVGKSFQAGKYLIQFEDDSTGSINLRELRSQFDSSLVHSGGTGTTSTLVYDESVIPPDLSASFTGTLTPIRLYQAPPKVIWKPGGHPTERNIIRDWNTVLAAIVSRQGDIEVLCDSSVANCEIDGAASDMNLFGRTVFRASAPANLILKDGNVVVNPLRFEGPLTVLCKSPSTNKANIKLTSGAVLHVHDGAKLQRDSGNLAAAIVATGNSVLRFDQDGSAEALGETGSWLQINSSVSCQMVFTSMALAGVNPSSRVSGDSSSTLDTYNDQSVTMPSFSSFAGTYTNHHMY